MCMLVYGPSPTAKELFVMSVRETSAIGFLANWFFSEEEIKEIIERNSIKDTDDITDTDLIVIKDPGSGDAVNDETPDIQIIDVKGSTYRGKLMIVKDPSRVFVGTVPVFHLGNGLVVSDLAQRYNAIGGINGGEFVDGELTYTAMPVGLVMTDGQITNGNLNTTYHVTGITRDNVLVVGNMTGQQAINMNIRDCVSIHSSIGPFLIVNGEAQDVGGVGGGLNPRTAIGQRADGAILLLVIDGRQANSLGASFADLSYIMQEYGAVNASTMDGGTSTQMYYEGEVINVPYSPTGPRRCPTSFLVGGPES
jgi:exopolysaccharide biosynthesis protein